LSYDLLAFLDELVTINATAIMIIAVAINTGIEISSFNIAQPKNTAITGTIYADELAIDSDSA